MHDGQELVLRDIEYVPGLYKIFDEILVNAADNKVRDAKMDKLEVTIDPVSTSLRPNPAYTMAQWCRCAWKIIVSSHNHDTFNDWAYQV